MLSAVTNRPASLVQLSQRVYQKTKSFDISQAVLDELAKEHETCGCKITRDPDGSVNIPLRNGLIKYVAEDNKIIKLLYSLEV